MDLALVNIRMASETGGQVGERLTFQEQMRLVELPDVFRDGAVVKRYMSQRAAWVPGGDLPLSKKDNGMAATTYRYRSTAAYGGHVYSQSGMAASIAFSEIRAGSSESFAPKQFGIHVSIRP